MKQVESVNGKEFREMLSTATSWLEKSSSDIDALNVFPVPDGDTGTNMLLTMRSSVDESFATTATGLGEIAKAFAKGALMGARGNSGVILSQIWRGVAESLVDKKTMVAADFVDALKNAAVVAYKGITNPVEGTILTVVRDAGTAGAKALENGTTEMIAVMEAIVTGKPFKFSGFSHSVIQLVVTPTSPTRRPFSITRTAWGRMGRSPVSSVTLAQRH